MNKNISLDQFKVFFNSTPWVITHKDWDGIVSVAILKAFLKSRLGIDLKNTQIFLSQPNSLERNEVQKLPMGRQDRCTISYQGQSSFIIDLPYITGAKIWIDHHDGHKIPETQLRACQSYYFDETCPSAARLLSRTMKSFGFNVPEDILAFTDRFDSGMHGAKDTLEDLETAPLIRRLCYIIETYNQVKDIPLLYRIIDLIAKNLSRLETIDDPEVKAKYSELKGLRGNFRELIKASDYHNGLMILDQHKFNKEIAFAYWDIYPIFYNFLCKMVKSDLLYGYFWIRTPYKGRISCRLALIWRFQPQLIQLQKAKKLSIVSIGQSFGGDGHFDVVGFHVEETQKSTALRRLKTQWDALIQSWDKLLQNTPNL